jgi:hypothetical protein
MLWKRSVVMEDVETGTLWSHFLGEAMYGPLKGKTLVVLPSTVTDWGSWKEQHPETTVITLERTNRDFTPDYYDNSADFLIGVADDVDARAWPFDQLVKQPVVNDEFAGEPLVVKFDVSNSTATLWRRRVDDQVLDFLIENGDLIDRQSHSVWDGLSGRAISGPLKGKQLMQLPARLSYRRTWLDFYPDSRFWAAPEPADADR